MSFADLHCHLLWGIDDGAKTAEESLAMARTLVKLGFGAVAPSPHARPEYPGEAAVAARRAEAQALFARENIALDLHPGGEHLFDEAFLGHAVSKERRSINGTRYILVEAPYVGTIPGLPDLIFRLRTRGATPVIAHPERCAQFEGKGQAAEVARVGAALQLDVGALTGRYGKTARKLALQFLEQNLYAIAATDLHSPVGAEDWVGRSLEELKREVGKEGVTRLLETNPRRILAGEELDLP
jgi:protein-tyrosine phosphatase